MYTLFWVFFSLNLNINPQTDESKLDNPITQGVPPQWINKFHGLAMHGDHSNFDTTALQKHSTLYNCSLCLTLNPEITASNSLPIHWRLVPTLATRSVHWMLIPTLPKPSTSDQCYWITQGTDLQSMIVILQRWTNNWLNKNVIIMILNNIHISIKVVTGYIYEF